MLYDFFDKRAVWPRVASGAGLAAKLLFFGSSVAWKGVVIVVTWPLQFSTATVNLQSGVPSWINFIPQPNSCLGVPGNEKSQVPKKKQSQTPEVNRVSRNIADSILSPRNDRKNPSKQSLSPKVDFTQNSRGSLRWHLRFLKRRPQPWRSLQGKPLNRLDRLLQPCFFERPVYGWTTNKSGGCVSCSRNCEGFLLKSGRQIRLPKIPHQSSPFQLSPWNQTLFPRATRHKLKKQQSLNNWFWRRYLVCVWYKMWHLK